MLFKARRSAGRKKIKDPIQVFDDFFKSKDFRDLVRQSDLDQKEMVAQAEKIEKGQKTAKAVAVVSKPPKAKNKAARR